MECLADFLSRQSGGGGTYLTVSGASLLKCPSLVSF